MTAGVGRAYLSPSAKGSAIRLLDRLVPSAAFGDIILETEDLAI
jgi:hypothetical protein